MKNLITVDAAGKLSFIHNDDLFQAFCELGTRKVIKRASNVEPNDAGEWLADMSPVAAGIVLGPFKTRGEALAAETEWLNTHLFGGA